MRKALKHVGNERCLVHLCGEGAEKCNKRPAHEALGLDETMDHLVTHGFSWWFLNQVDAYANKHARDLLKDLESISVLNRSRWDVHQAKMARRGPMEGRKRKTGGDGEEAPLGEGKKKKKKKKNGDPSAYP